MSLNIAIIGSGIAGLAAAYRCSQAGYAVTLFEAQAGYGMDTHQLHCYGGVVDVPLRVMSAERWPSVLSLAAEVGVETFTVNTFVSCSVLADRPTAPSQQALLQTWLRSSRLPYLNLPFVGSWRYLNRNSLIISRGLWRLAHAVKQTQQLPQGDTLADFLARESFDPLFWRGLMLPILITICTCDEAELLTWPTEQLLGLLHDIMHGKSLRRLRGGTSALVKQLAAATKATCHMGSPVQQIEEMADGIRGQNARGDGGLFDRVLIATQANQLDFLAQTDYQTERDILAGIPYANGELVVHQDTRVMPRRRNDWTALNFHTDAQLNQATFHVWVNAVEPSLHGKPPIFQTWNPVFPLQPDKILSRTAFQRAVVSPTTAGILRQLHGWHQQPQRRLFYIGSWAYEGVPLLESAVQSANRVVQLLKQQSQQQQNPTTTAKSPS
jgi:predicted NAD/FAD-binding protein